MGKQGAKGRFEEFSSSIKTARGRMNLLRSEVTEALTGQPVVLEALEELQTTVAELEAAEDELLQQYEEILSAREEVEYERVRYRELFDFAPDAYIVTDKYGVITEANRAASDLFNIGGQFIAGKPLVSFIFDQDRRAFRDTLHRLAAASGVQEVELRLNPRHGSCLHGSFKVGTVRNSAGDTVGLRWLVRDNTGQKLAEDRIRKLNEELEERVRERTSQLAASNEMKEILLARAEKACADAEAASRSKDEFLAMVSHELRTPLNAVTGWIEILRRSSNGPEVLDHALEVIERNARAQAQIINDILEVSRMMTGNLNLVIRPLEIGPIIEKTIDEVGPALNAKGLQLQKSIEPTVRPVPGDADRIRQIVNNLLANAIKFTPRGGRIDVRLAEAGGQAQIIVSDTGKGIDPEFLPKVFDTFSQADSSSRRKQGGLGLGLAIVRQLVEMHGGSVRAESAGEGLGATFIKKL